MSTWSELAILSFIAEKPRHGYEIEAVIRERGVREWTDISFSSIYYLLKRLEKAGLIESQIVQKGQGPARKVYQLVPAGAEALHSGVIDALSEPRHFRPPILLGLANLPALSTDEALTALRGYRDGLVARLEHARARWEDQRPLPYFVDAMFDYSITLIEAEIEWVDKFTRRLEER